MIGKTISHYNIVDKLGEGGMGVVYKAHDKQLDRVVALKVLPAEMAEDAERLERFRREARAVAALNHPNIVTIFAVDEVDGVPFLAMEFIEGQTLDEVTPADGLPLSRFFELAIPIADALTAAHERGVIHRDLKPPNILVSTGGVVKVLDWGLAKVHGPPDGESGEMQTATLTQVGRIMGTVPYMSPEQVQGRPVDHRSDIFSLGITLYEMATGQRPFVGESSAELASSILRDTPISVTDLRGGLPRHLGRIIRHCIEKDPQRRYQTALDVANELQDLRREIASGELTLRDAVPATVVVDSAQKTYRTPLIARDDERNELRRLLEQASEGRGALLMIGGEPGVGKTRLIEELIPEAREQGFLTLVGHCYDTEVARPLSPWAEILETTARIAPRETLRQLLGDAAPEVAKVLPELRRIFPDIPQPVSLPPEQERHYLFNSFGEYIERASRVQPLLLVLEDLQWADETTLLLLEHEAKRLNEIAVLVIGTYRDAELDGSRPLGQALRQLVRERLAQRLALKRLPKEGVAEMVAALSGQKPPYRLVELLFEVTEGNPFFIEEVFQHLQEEGELFDSEGRWRRDLRIEDLDVPEGVRLVVSRRLERLSDEARKVLTSAAIIGRRFSFDVLESLGDADPDAVVDAVEEAERLQLIRPVSGREIRFDFAQELVRQTLAAGLSSLRRQRLHLRIAEAMEQIFAGDLENRAFALAHHLFQAGAAADVDRTVRYLTLAGEQAFRSAAFEDALGFYDDAISLLEPEAVDRRAELLFRRGWTKRSLGRWEEGKNDWLDALPLYEKAGNTRAAVRICRGLATQAAWELRPEEAEKTAQRGLSIVGPEPSADRCRLLATSGLTRSQLGDFESAESAFEEAEAMAREMQSQSLLGEVYGFKTIYLLYLMQATELQEVGRQAADALRARGDQWQLAAILSFYQTGLFTGGRLSAAAEVGEELEELAEKVGHIGGQWLSRRNRTAREVVLTGRFSALEEYRDIDRGFAEQLNRSNVTGDANLASMMFWQGKWSDAVAQAERAWEMEPSDELQNAGMGWASLFLVTSYLGDRKKALSLLKARRPELPREGGVASMGAWATLFAQIEGFAHLGESERAAVLYPSVVEALAAGARIRSVSYGFIETVAGIAATAGGDWAKAEEHYQSALGEAQALPHLIEQPEVRRWYANMLLQRDASGDRDQARELLQEAIAKYKELAMPRHVEMAEELLLRV